MQNDFFVTLWTNIPNPPPFLDVSVFLIWPYFTLDPINKVILRQDVISECKRTRVWWFPTDLWKSHNLFIEKWSLIEMRETPSLKLWWVSSDSHCNFYIENGILWGEKHKRTGSWLLFIWRVSWTHSLHYTESAPVSVLVKCLHNPLLIPNLN